MRSPLLRSSATIALGAAALVTLIAASPAIERVDGYQITMKVTMEVPGAAQAGMPAGPTQMDVVIKSAGDRIRMEMDMAKLMSGRGGDAANQAAAASAMMGGMYILVQPDGKMMTVMPSMGMAMVADPSAMLGGGGGMGGMMSMTLDTLPGWLKVTDLGAGERILGFATRKYRVETRVKTTVSVMGTTTSDSAESTYDIWVTSDASDALAAIRKYSQTMGSSVMGGSKDVFDAWMKKLPANAVGLRTIGTSTSEKGKTTFNMEIAEIKKATFEATEFEVPAGMQVMDMGAMMGGRGRGRGGMN